MDMKGVADMNDAQARNSGRSVGLRAVLAAKMLAAALAFTLLPSFAAGPAGRSVPQGNPRLANLQIEIWPEYDRPAALVILRGEIPAEIPLPAALSLRIPAASGGPSAVASSAENGGNLLSMKYRREDAKDFITLKFESPNRFFHVELYEPIDTHTSERNFAYLWQGDLAADRLSVVLQEPAGASDFSVVPNLENSASGQDGLRYRSADMGAFETKEELPIKVRYTKTDSRTSAEMLKSKSGASVPASVPAASLDANQELYLGLFGAAGGVALGAAAVVLWWRKRNDNPGARSDRAGFCPKCGTPSGAGDRFCAKCGARLA